MTDKKPASGKSTNPSPSPGVRRISQPRPRKTPAKPDSAPPTPSGAGILPAAPESGQDARPTPSSGAGILPAAPESGQDARPTPSSGAGILPAAPESGHDARPTSSSGAGILPSAPESGHDARSTTPVPEAPSSGEWPEPDAASSGGTGSPDHKRKRRRRKGKGQSAQAHSAAITAEESPPHDEAAEPSVATATFAVLPPKPAPALPPPPRQPAAPRAKVDPETLARKAWKIFLAEVSEEGVALIGDQDARELARRCFRLAEIFIEEQTRRVP